MYNTLTAAQSDVLLINFGGEVMTDWEIKRELLHDVKYASYAAVVALIMLLIVTRSFFLTCVGLFQILVCFSTCLRDTFVNYNDRSSTALNPAC